MQFISELRGDGLVERRFVLAGIDGILWTPESASASSPVPLVLAGQPAGPWGLDRTHQRIRARALSAAASGFATATIENPGAGSRPAPAGAESARAEMRAAIAAGEPVPDAVTERLILPLVDQAVPEWQAAMDALLALDELNGPVGIAGGVISIGVRLAAVDERIAAAVLFAGSYVPRSIIDQARTVTIPVHMLLQWDDEGNDRQQALDLFDAFGSADKTLTANLGGHTGVPEHAGAAADAFLRRHLLLVSDGDCC